ncbi:MAG TPA: hypothetical protein VLK84_06225, partial [Longimicrobium sp.]|nr:hypothetical protein [Longimicrobium sp.]
MPTPPTDPDLRAERFGVLDADADPLGPGRLLVVPRGGGAARVLTPPEAQVFAAIGTVGTLAELADACLRALPPAVLAALAGREPADGARAGVEAALRSFVAGGLLAAEGAALERLAAVPDAPPPGITSVCIPTRDRLPVLLRALRGFADNDTAHGRATTFVVMDDSDDPRSGRRHRDALRILAADSGRILRHAPRGARERFARRLARRAGVAEATARFALLGDGRFASSHGAARNALLLDTAGELSLFVDDDFVCRPGVPPGARQELALSPRGDGNEYWFGATGDAVQALVSPAAVDFLEVHERMLGRSPAGCVARARELGMPVRIADGWAVGTLMRGDARVMNTFAGIVGDVGGPGRHHPRLQMRGESFDRLVSDGDGYAARLHSRHVLKSPVRFSLAPDSYCMAGNMGVDGRTLPPPFMPVQIAEDIVFGVCRRMLHPTACSGYLPFAIPHLPPGPRRSAEAPPPLTFISNRVVSTALARATDVWPPGDAAAGFAAAGTYLRALGTAPG